MKKFTKTIVSITCLALAAALFAMPATGLAAEKKMVVGSKEFTEQRILGQIMISLLEKHGFETVDKTGLGGTLVVRKALENDQIDIAMEYTGTTLVTHLKQKTIITDPVECYNFVKEKDEANGIAWLPYMPFNNTYCLMMRQDHAEKLGIASLSDLANYVKAHPKDVSLGINAEFYARPDGYRPLQKKYGFKFPKDKIVKMSSGLLYKALRDSQVDVAMGFATDGRIKGFDLLVLKDDLQYFPVYNPAPMVKQETLTKYPELETIFSDLAKHLDTAAMTNLNFQVDGEHKNVKDVATEWLKSVGLI